MNRIAFLGVVASLVASVIPLYGQQKPVLLDSTLEVRLLEGEQIERLSLHDYLIGVVLEEMPASFETEALKAQAVAARTFTIRRMYAEGKHEDADVCGNPSCCQCYLDETERYSVYGDGLREAEKRVREAVESTDGQVLTVGEKLIEATYFSSTAGATESAASVWGGEVSYLQSVSSPEEPKMSEISVPFSEFRSAFSGANLSGRPEGWIGAVTYTEGGAVDLIRIGGIWYRGTAVRKLFSLKSAKFTVSVSDNTVIFTVSGSGHGVGMSQYGADTMAKQGIGYREILLHYYTGAELVQLY